LLDLEGGVKEEGQTNQLNEDDDERRDDLRVSYVGEPTVGDDGGMWKR
jgi:hypothetical protein